MVSTVRPIFRTDTYRVLYFVNDRALLCLQITLRLFDASIAWAEELARYLFVWANVFEHQLPHSR